MRVRARKGDRGKNKERQTDKDTEIYRQTSRQTVK